MPIDREQLKYLELGADIEDVVEIDNQDAQQIDKIADLEERVQALTNGLDNLFALVKSLRDDFNKEKDRLISEAIEQKKRDKKAEIPVGTVLYGSTHGLNYFLEVKEDGFYVGTIKYDSLSAAAEAVSGVRRSGWTFWKLPNGQTVKEVYKNIDSLYKKDEEVDIENGRE